MAFWMYAVVALGWFTGGIVGGATGMGSVMVSMPILMTVFPAGDAVLISCLCALYGNIHLIMVYHKLASSKDVRELIIGCLPRCLLGTLVLKIAPVQVLELMVCAMLVCFIIMRYRSGASAYRLSDSPTIGIGAGIVSGFVHSSVALSGAPLGIYALLRQWGPDRVRGNFSIFFFLASLGTVGSQAFAGLYRTELFPLALMGIMGCAAGQYAGVRIGRHINQLLFQRIIVVFLALTAVVLLIRALE